MTYDLSDAEIVKTIVFSTAHITAADSKALHEMEPTGLVFNDDFMHRINLDSFNDDRETFVRYGLSQVFFDLVSTAKNQSCNKMELDSDGPEYACMPTFVW